MNLPSSNSLPATESLSPASPIAASPASPPLSQPNLPFRRELLLGTLPLLLAPVGVAAVMSHQATAQQQTKQAEQDLQNQTISMGQVTRDRLNEAKKIPRLVAPDPAIIEFSRQAVRGVEAIQLDRISGATIEQEKRQGLPANMNLNDYLKRKAAGAEFSDLVITEEHGVDIASNRPGPRVVHRSTTWWQEVQQADEVVKPVFNGDGSIAGIDVAKAIVDPASGQQLGAVKGRLPADYLDQVLTRVPLAKLSDSLQIQILALTKNNLMQPIRTLSSNGLRDTSEVLGGTAIAEKATELVKQLSVQTQTTQPTTKSFDYGNGDRGLLTVTSQGNQRYILATIPGSNWVAVGAMTQKELASQSWPWALAVLIVVLTGVTSAISILTIRRLSKLLSELNLAFDQVSAGNWDVKVKPEGPTEMKNLAQRFNQLTTGVNTLLSTHSEALKQSQFYNNLAHTAIQADRRTVFNLVVTGARELLAADRVIVYLFDKDWSGTVAAESVLQQYPTALGADITDPCFVNSYVEKYRRGRVHALSNIYEANLDHCYMSQLEPFEVKANIVAPILLHQQLLGLLCVHQCSGPRVWQGSEINFLRQAAIELGFALEQVTVLEQKEQARLQAEILSQEQLQKTRSLQEQLVELLSSVEGAARGDLTVRAEVTAGEIGTVADFFNSIVENLRQIVNQVKESALEVNQALGKNEQAMRQLAEDALKQAEETTLTLQTVEEMKYSIQQVAESASQAADVAQTASEAAQEGELAMDLTVQNILKLRETIGETAKKVKRLGESSQEISKVVSLINQIATQTNLLAINAGIEAARAGEGGQGFAVVAEEVGELAARSASATQEIEQIVQTIQRETSEVVEAMEQGTTQVVEGTYLVKNTRQSLEQIVNVSQQIDQLVQSISKATVSQVETSQAIAVLMQDVAQVAGQTSGSSRQVSTSLRQTVDIAKELQESVEMFKVI